MRALTNPRLNPVTWWVTALALVVCCTASANPLVLAIAAALAIFSIAIHALRGAAEVRIQTLRSLRFYLLLALFVVVVRVVFRAIFNLGFNPNDALLLDLPRLSINLGVGQLEILGPLTLHTFLAGLVDGLRLAAIILSVAMASILANPRQLLKIMPGALFEIASTVSVALNLAPQLIESLQRVRRARRLRGRSAGISTLPSLVIPVLEDTLERSLGLAASLDARGFGRTTNIGRPILARSLSLGSVTLLGIASYLLLTDSQTTLPSWILLLLGLASLAVSLRLSSARGQRSVYNRAGWSAWDLTLLAGALALVALAWWGGASWLVTAT